MGHTTRSPALQRTMAWERNRRHDHALGILRSIWLFERDEAHPVVDRLVLGQLRYRIDCAHDRNRHDLVVEGMILAAGLRDLLDHEEYVAICEGLEEDFRHDGDWYDRLEELARVEARLSAVAEDPAEAEAVIDEPGRGTPSQRTTEAVAGLREQEADVLGRLLVGGR